MLVALQLVGIANVPLNLTLPVPWVVPKFAPLIVTLVPTGPAVGDNDVMLGASGATVVTVNGSPLLATLFAVTTTFPVVAPLGTGTTMLVPLQLVGVASVPLNLTLPGPCVVPKFAPLIVTLVPTGPDVGDNDVMLGAVAALPVIVTLLNETVAAVDAV
jgi:uncharacterized protein (DUF779 family)